MPKNQKYSRHERRLLKRYLVWCYKTTKEEVDRIDRYFTQFDVDEYLLARLKKALGKEKNPDIEKLVEHFDSYKNKKKRNAEAKKFIKAGQLHPDYAYLKMRLSAIEDAIVHFLGAKELGKITSLYETEMTRRIIEAREHT